MDIWKCSYFSFCQPITLTHTLLLVQVLFLNTGCKYEVYIHNFIKKRARRLCDLISKSWFVPKTRNTFTTTDPLLQILWSQTCFQCGFVPSRLSLFLFFSLWFHHCTGCWLNSHHTVSTTYLVHHGRKTKNKKHNSTLLERRIPCLLVCLLGVILHHSIS